LRVGRWHGETARVRWPTRIFLFYGGGPGCFGAECLRLVPGSGRDVFVLAQFSGRCHSLLRDRRSRFRTWFNAQRERTCMSVFGGEVELEHFPNLRGVARLVKGGFYFHPSDEDLSPRARLRKSYSAVAAHSTPIRKML
jgi:hypothetical protein